MAGPAFDPSGAVRFDLKSGAASDTRGARLLLVPASALEALDAPTLQLLGREIGRACGARVAARLGGDAGVRSAQLEVVVSHLAGELAVAGLGAIHVERWGRAMVAVLANPSVAKDEFLAAVVGAAIGAASGRDLAGATLGRDGTSVRIFLGAQATADKVRASVAAGKSHAEILSALQSGGQS
jgi:hypothetical protein